MPVSKKRSKMCFQFLLQVGHNLNSTEDAYSTKAHIEGMQKEMEKPIRNMKKIQDSIERTFEARRHWIVTQRPLAKEVLGEYPALAMPEEARIVR
ncbi:hypothetical protein HPB48_000803 [Haemaphysalis longicornis]|uniref:Uncharacterized protein n=1 Tax=Haemaphysalis longicornis TaxID=44386 RepID=A0A9J6G7X5_HAELO|nr:hypothetical protein HPB48_000803 [Haemaphysalis longicornis]